MIDTSYEPALVAPAAQRFRRKVLLVDDHAVVRTGLATLINAEDDLVTCGEADCERAALDAVGKLRPDVALVDWSLRNQDAAGLIEALHQGDPLLPILVLSIHDEIFYAERALAAGASGYVMKQEATERIIDALRQVAAGRSYLSERAAQTVRRRLAEKLEQDAAPAPSHMADDPPILPGTRATLLSIVIPVFNSEKTIVRLVGELIEELDPTFGLQIILVDDGSLDGSAAVCRRLHERHPRIVELVSLARNFGEHNAVMAGLNCAEGDYCVIMDDDFQNPPSEVRKLVEEIRKGHDVVYVQYNQKHHSLFRNLGSRLHNWMATRVLGKPPGLYLSSFKAMSRFLVREVVRYTGPDPYLDAIILRTTRNIGVVTVRHEPRENGRSGYTLRKLIALWGNMVIAFSVYPMRLLGLFGIAMAGIGMVYGVLTLVSLLMPTVAPPDTYQRLNATMWFLRGMTLLFLSVVAEYVGRIYMQSNRDPQFIVRGILRRRVDG
jgi:DNA-binding NarL/FixJ family response regulator/glycosyltransferase involved in cell wall biosynthesis